MSSAALKSFQCLAQAAALMAFRQCSQCTDILSAFCTRYYVGNGKLQFKCCNKVTIKLLVK